MNTSAQPKLDNLRLKLHERQYAVLELARPGRSNAFTDALLTEFVLALEWLDSCPDVLAVVICGQGRNFCAGIDLESLTEVAGLLKMSDSGRAAAAFRRKILRMQEAFTAIERCRWPVIAAVQGACVGGGVDLIAACDIRYCAADAVFSIKEVDLAITADLGSLQRLPPIIGHGATAELALTARHFGAAEAKALGLVTEVLPDLEALQQKAVAAAVMLASKSPLALTGTKQVLLHARDSSVTSGLQFVAAWNSGQALSGDLKEVLAARDARRPPAFSKL